MKYVFATALLLLTTLGHAAPDIRGNTVTFPSTDTYWYLYQVGNDSGPPLCDVYQNPDGICELPDGFYYWSLGGEQQGFRLPLGSPDSFKNCSATNNGEETGEGGFLEGDTLGCSLVCPSDTKPRGIACGAIATSAAQLLAGQASPEIESLPIQVTRSQRGVSCQYIGSPYVTDDSLRSFIDLTLSLDCEAR